MSVGLDKSVDQDYTCDTQEVLETFRNGVINRPRPGTRAPKNYRNRGKGGKPGPITRFLTISERKQIIELVSNGKSKRNACEQLKIPYSVYYNSYYDEEDTSFRFELDNARNAAYEKLADKGFELAIKENDKDALFYMIDRVDKFNSGAIALQKFLVAEKNRMKIAELQASQKSQAINYLMYTFNPLQAALSECLDPDTANKVMSIYAEKMAELAKQLEAEEGGGQMMIESSCIEESK